jgi:hypothetical protein
MRVRDVGKSECFPVAGKIGIQTLSHPKGD